MIVFYSWQSDLPTKCNRGLIEDALQSACSELRDDETVDVDPVVDRDTEGTSGAVAIADTIFDKIARADVFVADVTQIGVAGDSERPTPNPNVLVELGYAAAALGWEHIVLVANTHYGKLESLPFDLRGRRCLGYENDPDVQERATARASLKLRFSAAIRDIVARDRVAESPEQKYGLAPVAVKLARWALDADDGSFFERSSLDKFAALEQEDVEDVRAWAEHLHGAGVLELEDGGFGSTGRVLCSGGVFKLAGAQKQAEVESDASAMATMLLDHERLSWQELEGTCEGVHVRIGHAVRLLEWQGLVTIRRDATGSLGIGGIRRTPKFRRECMG